VTIDADGLYRFTVSSVVPASPARVWERITTMEGINAELMPIARMTHPRGLTRLPFPVPIGERLFRSWILLFGVLPIDYDDVTLLRLTPGVGFAESSPMLTQRRWDHERTLEDANGACRVTDRIAFAPRLALLGPVYRAIFRQVFLHRHRRLCSAFAHSIP
jgi:ligand-binding SRPBCC domain-containing protein